MAEEQFTEYGVKLPSGDYRWNERSLLYGELSTYQAQQDYLNNFKNTLTNAGLDDSIADQLTFVQRDVTLTYGRAKKNDLTGPREDEIIAVPIDEPEGAAEETSEEKETK